MDNDYIDSKRFAKILVVRLKGLSGFQGATAGDNLKLLVAINYKCGEYCHQCTNEGASKEQPYFIVFS